MYALLKAVSDASVPPASQLQVLQLYHDEQSGYEISTFPRSGLYEYFPLFGGFAPRLHNISLSGVHVDWTQGWLQSPNLVELKLARHTLDVRPDWPTFAAVLRATVPTLEKLCLDTSGPFGSHVALSWCPPFGVISLLQNLCLPPLKALTLDFGDEECTDLFTYLVGPDTTAIPTTSSMEQPRSLLRGLESLKIADLRCDEESIEQLYNELVDITSLNLSMHHLSFSFFENLYPQPPPKLEETGPCDPTVSYRVLLPRLTTLFFSNVPGDDLRRFVHECQWVGVPLRMVFVEKNTDVTFEEESWFKENLEKFDYFEGSDAKDAHDDWSVSSSYVSTYARGVWQKQYDLEGSPAYYDMVERGTESE
ncbi:hypothetical protein EDC04DRAFT_2912086 [Pisolithus marmoratus]|nr:hypothetical protein EDC04DRAFT_2912086 [Pisolithus marmoratus]